LLIILLLIDHVELLPQEHRPLLTQKRLATCRKRLEADLSRGRHNWVLPSASWFPLKCFPPIVVVPVDPKALLLQLLELV
jgi:hypothetical protein